MCLAVSHPLPLALFGVDELLQIDMQKWTLPSQIQLWWAIDLPICMGDDFGRADPVYKTRHYGAFAEVMEIHVEGASNLLYTRLLHTLNYLPHYHAYAIRDVQPF